MRNLKITIRDPDKAFSGRLDRCSVCGRFLSRGLLPFCRHCWNPERLAWMPTVIVMLSVLQGLGEWWARIKFFDHALGDDLQT